MLLSRGAEGMWVLLLSGRAIDWELASYRLNDITFYMTLFITTSQNYASFPTYQANAYAQEVSKSKFEAQHRFRIPRGKLRI